MFIVIKGNPVDGFTFHGPFDSAEAASEWAGRSEYTGWAAARLIEPGD